MTFYRTESVGTKPISTRFKRCRRRRHGQVLVPAPTGKAVDVAVHEGAGDTGYTLAKAPHRVQDGTLKLGHLDLVIIDEAGMVGTNDLRQLLTATTRANAKTVLVGDAHQLAPAKARGGIFAQLCDDLPWTQELSEVWRMRAVAESRHRKDRGGYGSIRQPGVAPAAGQAVDPVAAQQRHRRRFGKQKPH